MSSEYCKYPRMPGCKFPISLGQNSEQSGLVAMKQRKRQEKNGYDSFHIMSGTGTK